MDQNNPMEGVSHAGGVNVSFTVTFNQVGMVLFIPESDKQIYPIPSYGKLSSYVVTCSNDRAINIWNDVEKIPTIWKAEGCQYWLNVFCWWIEFPWWFSQMLYFQETYKCVAIICQEGCTDDTRHYFAYIYQNELWVKANDSKVTCWACWAYEMEMA